MSARTQSEYCALLQSAAQKLGQAPRGKQLAGLSDLVLRVHDRLVRPPRILLFGEINSGKSSLANLLIGEFVVPTSVVANSRFPIRFYYAARPSLASVLRDGRRQALAWSEIHHLARLPVERVEVGLPVERLRTFEVVDTPGTGSPVGEACRLERQGSLAHLPIWCTVAARAWKESERREWSRLARAKKARGILAVTQIDLLPDKADLAKVLARLEGETAGLFGAIAPVAVPDALTSSVVIDGAARLQDLWVESGGAQLERVITGSLSDIAEQRVASAKRALLRAVLRRGLLTGKDDPSRELGRGARNASEPILDATMAQLGADVLGALIPDLDQPGVGDSGQDDPGRDDELEDERTSRGLSQLRRREEIGL